MVIPGRDTGRGSLLKAGYRAGAVLICLAVAVSGWAAFSAAMRPSIAVRIDYDGNVSADDVRLADGIAIELTRQLGSIEGLDVRAAAPASAQGNHWPDPAAFGRERGARLILEGSVLSEPRVVHASLVTASGGSILWSGSFATGSKDILTVLGTVTAATAETLGLRFRSGRREYSIDPVLQRHFLKARALQANGGNVNRPEAVDLFEQITKERSSFVPAVAALATTLGGRLSISGWRPVDPRMAAAARAAYDADPQLAEANVAMGLLSARQCQWSRADDYFATAFSLDPSVTAARIDYVVSTLLPLGRIEDALDVLNEALAADPKSLDAGRTLAYVQLLNGDYDGALETSRWVIEQDPELEFADQSRGRALYLSQRTGEALEWFGTTESQWGQRGYLLALIGRHEEARKLAEAHPGEPARRLLIYAGLKDEERAFEAFRETAKGDPWRALVWMRWPEIEPVLRGDSRVAAIRATLLRPADEGGCSAH